MFIRDILWIIGYYLLGFAAILLIPTAVAGYFQFLEPDAHPQPHTTLYFVETILLSLLLAGFCFYFGKKNIGTIYRREGIAAVVLIWFLTPALSALPFLLSGTLANPHQAYFEMVSGYTTTGATILQAKKFDSKTGQEIPIHRIVPGVHNTEYIYYGTVDPVVNPETGKIEIEGIEAVSRALLFWRSLTQFLGGGGVVVLFVAILPALGVGGKMLFQAEVPGPVKEGLNPRIKETAMHLWKIYIVLTIVQIALIKMTNSSLGWLDIVTITFGSLSTGGFAVTNTNIAAYNSLSLEIIVMLFMFLGSVNFALYHYIYKRKFYKLYESEFILHIFLTLLFALSISYFIIGSEKMTLKGIVEGTYSSSEALRYGFFQSISAHTSTGFDTINFDIWPYLPQVLFLISMYIGGMSGSTAGGMKTIRFHMLYNIAKHKIESVFRPQAVHKLRINEREVDTSASVRVLTYFLLAMTLSVLATLLFTFDSIDPESALSATACFINNVGLSFRAGGPLETFAFMSDFSLALSSFLMIIGRLEFFAVLALLAPSFWRQDS